MFDGMNVVRNVRMSEYTTLKLGGPADLMASPESTEEISALFAEAGRNGIPVTVIGHGSNLLVTDKGIRGLVIRLGKPMSRVNVNGNVIRAQSGVMLGTLAMAAADAGLTGLEFASGIPGTLGGAVTMNAGAYDGEMKQVVTRVWGVRSDGTTVCYSGEEMEFGYRTSRVQREDLIVTEAELTLTPGEREIIRNKMSELNGRRAEKQPLNLPSAGSTFKRPEGYFAAALIDQCGLKGYRIGGAEVSTKHAGFLVNQGESAADFLALIRYVQKVVEERVGVKLETEVKILGEE